jgi:hypothetical protein
MRRSKSEPLVNSWDYNSIFDVQHVSTPAVKKRKATIAKSPMQQHKPSPLITRRQLQTPPSPRHISIRKSNENIPLSHQPSLPHHNFVPSPAPAPLTVPLPPPPPPLPSHPSPQQHAYISVPPLMPNGLPRPKSTSYATEEGKHKLGFYALPELLLLLLTHILTITRYISPYKEREVYWRQNKKYPQRR